MVKTAQRYLQILKQQKRPWRFFVSRVLWRSRLCSLFQIRTQNYRLKFHPTALSAILWIDPQNRQGDEIFLNRYLRTDDTVIDVGANIGQLGLAAASLVGPQGKVYCIEAHPKIYLFLQSNVALNKFSNIVILNLALGNRETEIIFSDLRDDDQNRILESERGISVKMTRLDDVPLPVQYIQLLKIDVEGYEKFVLEGAAQTLAKTSCIYFESYDRHFRRYHYDCCDVIALLEKSGFTVLKLTGDETVVPVHGDYISTRCENLVAVRRVEEFLRRTGFCLTQ